MSTLFISHSSRDNEESRRLEAWLKEHKYESVFLDLDPEKGIQAGASWERTLYTKLRACRAVVALCSKNYLASQWCFAEVALARMEGKELFALQIEPWDEETKLPSILTERQFIDLRSDREGGYERLRLGFQALGIVPEKHRDWIPGKPPFPGLRAFDEKDAPIFFGRDAEVLEGVELMTSVRRQGHPRLVMVLGSSGSGKSSLARAGIVPRLRGDPDRWLVVGPFRPGARPMAELARAFERAFGEVEGAPSLDAIYGRLEPAGEPPAESPGGAEDDVAGISARERLRRALRALEGELTEDDPRVGESVRRLLDHLGAPATDAPSRTGRSLLEPTGNRLADLANELRFRRDQSEASVVLVVDQFEELLGHEAAGPDHAANRFLELLKAGIEAEDAPALALGTMRSDFLGLLQRSGPLRGVGFKSLSVGPMSEKGMLDVVVRPAQLGGIDLEEGLTNQLLKETGTADALPLLAFTLRAMWDRFHESRRFAIDDYDKMGRLQGAIAKVADDTLVAALRKGGGGEEGAGKREAELELRKAFLNLARPAAEGSGWARQPASWDDLPERARPMLEQFIEQRLLLKRQDGTVEVAHEALFRSWDKLKGWLNESAEALHLRDEIAAAAAGWDKVEAEEKKDHLWSGGRLVRALELRDGGLLDLKEMERAFVEASDDAEQAAARAEEARRQRELEQAQQLAEEQRKLAEEQARSARRTRIAAGLIGAALIGALYSLWIAVEKKREAEDQTRVALARNWLERDPTRAALVLLEVRDPDKTAYTVQLMGDALREPLALFELRGHTSEVRDAAFSPAGDRIVTASADGTARIWMLDADGHPAGTADGNAAYVELSSHTGPVLGATFDGAGERIVTSSEDGTARIWSKDGAEQVVIEHEGRVVRSAAFSPAGDRVVTVSNRRAGATAFAEGTVSVWNADGSPFLAGKSQVVLADEGAVIRGAAFLGEDRIVTAMGTGTARLWDARTGEAIDPPLKGHRESIESVAVLTDPSDESRIIVTGSTDETARLWTADGAPILQRDGRPVEMEHDGEIYRVAVSADGSRIVTASDDYTARLWRSNGRPALSADWSRQIVFRHAGEITAAAFSPDGGRVVTAAKDGTARVWSARGGSEPLVLPHSWALRAFFGPQGEILTASLRRDVRIWERERRDEPLPLPSDAIEVWSSDPEAGHIEFEGSAWTPSIVPGPEGSGGGRFLTASRDGTAQVWSADGDPVSGEGPGSARIPILMRHDPKGEEWINHASFDLSGNRIVTASNDGTARLWAADGTAIEPDRQIVLSHGGPVTSAVFSPVREEILTSSKDGKARLWKIGQATEPVAVLEHPAEVSSAAFSPSGDRIVTTAGLRAWLWNGDGSGPLERPEMQHDNEVTTATFSPSGDRIVTGSRDYTARIWNTDGRGDFLMLKGEDNLVSHAVFSPEGDRVVTISDKEGARIWRVSFGLLASKIRAVTALCLDQGFREEALRESSRKARRRAEACRKCLKDYYGRASLAGPEEASTAYLKCFL